MSTSLSFWDVYSPIRAGEIRLLKILPFGFDDDNIRCCLQVYPFDRAPPYVALSYAWGDVGLTSTITLNESPFMVRRNLKAALLRLQDWDSRENYWIDALCIDQSNLKERGEQVQLMGEIFSRCKVVFIWLGKGEGTDTAAALSLIRKWADLDWIMECIKPYELQGVEADDICERTARTVELVLKNSPSSLMRFFGPLMLEQPSLEAVIQLLEEPYWQRMWILQEIILSRRATVFYGDSHLDWRYFKLFQSIVSGVLAARATLFRLDPDETRFDMRHFSQSTETRTLQWLLSKRLEIFTAAKTNHEITDLEWRLHQTVNYQAGDPRDKLYALLGLDRQGSIPIKPNYEHSLGQAYADFVRGALHIGKLRLCGTNGVGYKKKNIYSDEWMPTWVPDLRPLRYPKQTVIDPSSNDLEEFGGCESVERLRRTNKCQVHAAGDSEPCFSIYDESLILEAEGVAIDHIEAFEAPGYSFDPTTNGVSSQVRWHKLVRDHCNVPHPAGLPRWQAYFRTLILDNDWLISERAAGFLASFEFVPEEQSPRISRGWDFEGDRFLSQEDQDWVSDAEVEEFRQDIKLMWLSRFLTMSGLNRSAGHALRDGGQDGSTRRSSTPKILHGFYGPDGASPGSSLTYIAIGENMDKYIAQYIEATLNTGGRSLFVTPRGYIGIGPPEIQKGDKVCILLGCDIPLIIRPGTDHYEVVGDCFVYGIMKGEAMKDVEESRLKLETFKFN